MHSHGGANGRSFFDWLDSLVMQAPSGPQQGVPQMRFSLRVLTAILLVLGGGAQWAHGAVAVSQNGDINNGGVGFGGLVNVYASAGMPFSFDDTATYLNNDVVRYTQNGVGGSNGAGLSFAISNGENGITSTAGGTNLDIDNTEPADPVFTTIGNASGKLENGNAVRVSMWMRQDPNDPVTAEPQIEPVVKIELWKEALSGSADFNAVPFPGCCDRIWDTDQNASNALFNGFNQSQASWVDMNNDGDIASGRPVATSLVTDEWRLVETTLVVDDDPLDDTIGWTIGPTGGEEQFTVADVEEIRGVMFFGDFLATDLTNGGSILVDNIMMEVFADEATMNATPNPNTAPVEMMGLRGDYNHNDIIDAADYTVWRDALEGDGVLTNDDDGMADNGDFTYWRDHFGETMGSGAGAGSAAAVPEPGCFVLLVMASAGMALARRRR